MKKIFVVFIMFLLCQNLVFAKDKYQTRYDDGIYYIVIPFDGVTNRINFVSSEKLLTNKKMLKKSGADLVVNAGFFDPKNEKAISFVYTDGMLTESPMLNENLLHNPTIVANWDKIANRAEFRITKDEVGYKYDICMHDEEVIGELITSAQAGPMLLPEMDLEKEYFVVKENGKVVRESASVLHKVPRTLIGLKGNEIHIIVATDKHPMTIYEAKTLCEELVLEKAMAFDGGSSTSLDTKSRIHVISTSTKFDNTGRKLKSFLILK